MKSTLDKRKIWKDFCQNSNSGYIWKKGWGLGSMGFQSLLVLFCLDQACLFVCLFYNAYFLVLKLKNNVLNYGTFFIRT